MITYLSTVLLLSAPSLEHKFFDCPSTGKVLRMMSKDTIGIPNTCYNKEPAYLVKFVCKGDYIHQEWYCQNSLRKVKSNE